MIDKLEFGNKMALVVDKKAFLTYADPQDLINEPAIKLTGNFRAFVYSCILIDLDEQSKKLLTKLDEDFSKALYKDTWSTECGYITGTTYPIEIGFVRTIEMIPMPAEITKLTCYLDGNALCIVGPTFINLQESDAMFIPLTPDQIAEFKKIK